MMTKTNTRTISTRSYETEYEATYEADHAITEAEASALIADKYHGFPITKAAASVKQRGQGNEAPPDERNPLMFFKSRKASKQKTYKNEAAIPVQFYTNENGETCFRETAKGDYKIGRNGRVIRRR